MTQEEIKEKIENNNNLIKKLMEPNTFVLNNTIYTLLEENKKLQSICNHTFEDGYCIYCQKAKKEEN